MNKIKITIFICLGAILGFLTEIFFYNGNSNLAILTQDYAFWFAIYMLGVVFSKGIKEAIVINIGSITSMNILYYLTRIILNQPFYLSSFVKFIILGIVGAIIIGTLYKLPHKYKYYSFFIYAVSSITIFYEYAIKQSGHTTSTINNLNFDSNYYIIIAVIVSVANIINIIKLNKENKKANICSRKNSR